MRLRRQHVDKKGFALWRLTLSVASCYIAYEQKHGIRMPSFASSCIALVQAPTRFGALAYILSRRTAYRIGKEKRTMSLKSTCLSLLLLFIAIRTDGQEQLAPRHVTSSEGNP